MRVIAVATVVAVASVVVEGGAPISYTWEDCGGTSTHSKVKSLVSEPASPVMGESVTFLGTGIVDEKVEDGPDAQYTIVAKNSWGIQLFSHTDKICGDSVINLPLGMGTIDVTGLVCPSGAGEVKLSQRMNLPSYLPFSTMKMTMSATDANKNSLLCMKINIKIGSGEEDFEHGMLTPDVMPALAYELGEEESVKATAATPTPVVVMHGMGDSGSNPGMKSLCASISSRYAGTYVKCLNVANGLSSITTKLDKQLAQFTEQITSDPKLAGGFNAVGLSQGNLLVRAYIERVNSPKVGTFISMDGPMNGVATCPDNFIYKLVCPLWKIAPYSAPIAFSDYWKDPTNQAKYLQKSRFLADINNEKETKNQTYKANMVALDKYVLVEALKDTMVQPHQSEQHGYYAWGSSTVLEQMEETEAYKGDWIGLQTLDKAGKLHKMSYNGNHMQWGAGFWSQKVLPLLAPKSEITSVVV